MDMSETREKSNEGDTTQTKMELDDKTAACRKRKRSDESSATPQKPSAEATTEAETNTDPRTYSVTQAEEIRRGIVGNRIARRLASFAVALDNYINYHIEKKQSKDDRVIVLRETMNRIHEVLRFFSYYTGAMVEGLEPQEPRL